MKLQRTDKCQIPVMVHLVMITSAATKPQGGGRGERLRKPAILQNKAHTEEEQDSKGQLIRRILKGNLTL